MTNLQCCTALYHNLHYELYRLSPTRHWSVWLPCSTVGPDTIGRKLHTRSNVNSLWYCASDKENDRKFVCKMIHDCISVEWDTVFLYHSNPPLGLFTRCVHNVTERTRKFTQARSVHGPRCERLVYRKQYMVIVFSFICFFNKIHERQRLHNRADSAKVSYNK